MNSKLYIVILLLFISMLALLIADSFYHNYTDEPEDSDVIIVLGGGDQGRMDKAAELYQAGYADTVIMTPIGDRFSGEELKSIGRHYGINEGDIIIEDDSGSTYTNAEESIEIMEEEGFDSALIVTNDYHIKRARLSFDRLNDGSMTFNYINAMNLSDERWYERENSGTIWMNEFVKTWGYRFGLYNWFG